MHKRANDAYVWINNYTKAIIGRILNFGVTGLFYSGGWGGGGNFSKPYYTQFHREMYQILDARLNLLTSQGCPYKFIRDSTWKLAQMSQIFMSLYSLTKFVQDNETDDPLLYPTEVNPFKEKARCIIL